MSAPRSPYRPTPGPWRVSCGSVYGPAGQYLADMYREHEGSGTVPTERDRNAEVMAAAPVMRDALLWIAAAKENARHFAPEDFERFTWDCIERAAAAVKGVPL